MTVEYSDLDDQLVKDMQQYISENFDDLNPSVIAERFGVSESCSAKLYKQVRKKKRNSFDFIR